jgi:hypothetical protein
MISSRDVGWFATARRYAALIGKAIGRTVDGEGDYSFRIDVRDNDKDDSSGITMSDGYASGAGTAPGET